MGLKKLAKKAKKAVAKKVDVVRKNPVYNVGKTLAKTGAMTMANYYTGGIAGQLLSGQSGSGSGSQFNEVVQNIPQGIESQMLPNVALESMDSSPQLAPVMVGSRGMKSGTGEKSESFIDMILHLIGG